MKHKKRSSRQQGREDLSGLVAPLFQTSPAEFIRILGAADAAHPLHPADPALAVIFIDEEGEPEERAGFIGDAEFLQRQFRLVVRDLSFPDDAAGNGPLTEEFLLHGGMGENRADAVAIGRRMRSISS